MPQSERPVRAGPRKRHRAEIALSPIVTARRRPACRRTHIGSLRRGPVRSGALGSFVSFVKRSLNYPHHDRTVQYSGLRCNPARLLKVGKSNIRGRNVTPTTSQTGESACHRVGRSTKTATASLGAASLVLASVLAAFLPGSIEQRFFSYLLFGALPALVFYLSGHIFYVLLTRSASLSEFICSRCLPRLPSYGRILVDRSAVPARTAVRCCSETGKRTRGLLLSTTQLLLSTTQQCRPFIHRCWRSRWIIAEPAFLLIRNTARLIIAVQRRMAETKFSSRTYSATWGSYRSDGWRLRRPVFVRVAYVVAFAAGWLAGLYLYQLVGTKKELAGATDINAAVDQIIRAESNGNPTAKNPHSSASGLGQFVNQTWLEMIRADRPDLAKQRDESELLELRQDPRLAREIITRFAEHNALVLRRRGLPVTAATLYLAHFSGSAGAVAILSAPEDADAAGVVASADRTGRTTRDEIIKANPFLEHFTVADLKNWAYCKMGAAASCSPNRPAGHVSPALAPSNGGPPLAFDLEK